MSKISSGKEKRVANPPVLQNQINAASRLHDRIAEFRTTANALQALRAKMPGWSREASLIKCIAVNAIYNTQVLDIKRMARHVSTILDGTAFSFSNEDH